MSVVFPLVVESEILGRRTCCDDHRISSNLQAAVCRADIGRLREIHLHDLTVANVSTEALGLFADLHHHLVGIHTLRIAGEILHLSGLGELSARLQTAVLNGAEVRTSGIDGSRITRRSAADNQTFCLFHIFYFLKFLIPWFRKSI